MEPLSVLNDLRVASPCPASWAAMQGDDRVRFCESCAKKVYNVSDLTAAEAASLLRANEGRLCMRLYRRRDGTLLTADCPVGLRYALRRRLLRLASAGVVLVVAARSALAVYRGADPPPATPPVPTGPGVTYVDWAHWAADTFGLRSSGTVTAGFICPLPSSVTGAPGS